MNLRDLWEAHDRVMHIKTDDRTAADVQALIDYHKGAAKWNAALAKNPHEGSTSHDFKRMASEHRKWARFYEKDLAVLLNKQEEEGEE